MALNKIERCDFVFALRVVDPDSLVCIREEKCLSRRSCILVFESLLNQYPGFHFTVFDESHV